METKELQGSLEHEQAKLSDFVRRNADLSDEMKSLKTENRRLSSEHTSSRAETEARGTSLAEIQSLAAELTKVKSASESTADELARERANAEGLRVELKRAREHLDAMRDKAAMAKAEAQVAKESAESKARHVEQADLALANLRAQLERMSVASESSRAEARSALAVTQQAAGATESKQKEIGVLAAQLADAKEQKDVQDQECARLRSQLVTEQARVNHLETKARECSGDMKMVGDIKVALMMISADMRDLSHQALLDQKHTELKVSEAQRSETFWQKEAESSKKALELIQHGQGEVSDKEVLKSQLESTRLELNRVLGDLAKHQEKADMDLALKDKTLSEVKERLLKAEAEKASEQTRREAVQEQLNKAVAEAQAQQGDIAVQKHEGAMLQVLSVKGAHENLVSMIDYMDKLQRRYEEERQLVDRMQAELDAVKSSLAEESRAAKSAAESKAEISGHVAELRALNSTLEEKLAAAILQRSTMVPKGEHDKAKAEASESRALASSLHDCVTVLDGEVADLKHQLQIAQAKATQLEDGSVDLVSKEALLDAQAESKVWQNESKSRKQEMDTMQEETRRLKSQVQQLSSEVSKAEAAMVAKELDVQQLRADIVRKNREMTDLTDAVSQLREEAKKSEANALKARGELMRANETHVKTVSKMVPKENAEAHRREVEKLQQEVRVQNAAAAEIREQLRQVRAESSEMMDSLSTTKKEMFKSQDDAERSKADAKRLQEALEIAEEQVTAFQEYSAMSSCAVEVLEKELSELEVQHEHIVSVSASMVAQLRQMAEELEAGKEQLRIKKVEIATLNQHLKDSDKLKKELQIQLKDLEQAATTHVREIKVRTQEVEEENLALRAALTAAEDKLVERQKQYTQLLEERAGLSNECEAHKAKSAALQLSVEALECTVKSLGESGPSSTSPAQVESDSARERLKAEAFGLRKDLSAKKVKSLY